GHGGHELCDRGVRVVDQDRDRVDQLAQVVGRDLGGHAHGDAVRAVEQQVGQPGGQYDRLLVAAVEVVDKGHRGLVDIGQELLGQLGQAHLGITHRGGVVVVDGAKVALA